VKSSSAAVVLAPAVTFSGMAVASLLVVCDGGEHIAASDAGICGIRLDRIQNVACCRLPWMLSSLAENVPTVGLLAGTTNV